MESEFDEQMLCIKEKHFNNFNDCLIYPNNEILHISTDSRKEHLYKPSTILKYKLEGTVIQEKTSI